MKHISRQQLVEALQLLAEFRSKVNKQGVQHVLPFLALRRKGVNEKTWTSYSEGDDKDFWNRYASVRGGEKPYFDPIASMFRIETHPHSNVATARKGTFDHSWKAAECRGTDGEESWKLRPKCVDIVRQKALTKGGQVTRVPAAALAAFLLRHQQLSDTANVAQLAGELKKAFNLDDKEYKGLFEDKTSISDFAAEPLAAADVVQAIEESGVVHETVEARSDFQELVITEQDPILARTRKLLFEDNYSGVVLVGPPGTSKSWYAVQLARAIADGDPSRVTKIQFHKSYQYEHFVEGFVPTAAGTGFELRDQIMLQVMKRAEASDGTHVLVIDELSRSDPGRVFGELLTYIEPSRRNEEFVLASGRPVAIPANIVIVATMNSRDKSVAEIDDAFDRRMAKISFGPSRSVLEKQLTETGVPEALRRRVLAFFDWIQPKYPIGHTYLFGVHDQESLQRVWDVQLRFVFEKEFKYEPVVLEEIRQKAAEILGIKTDGDGLQG